MNQPQGADVHRRFVEDRDESPATKVLRTSKLRKESDPEASQDGSPGEGEAGYDEPPGDRQHAENATGVPPHRRRTRVTRGIRTNFR